MNQELLFAQTLEKVRKQAKEQGNCVSSEQVEVAFKNLQLGEEQMKMVYDYLEKKNIGIGEPLADEEIMSEDDFDFLQAYLDELDLLEEATDGEKEAVTLSAMAGEKDAQNKLVEYYLKHVVDIAKLYAGQGVLLEDLIGEGNTALAVGVTMLGCLEHASEADGMLGKMIMDSMEEIIQETIGEKKIDGKILDKVNKIADKARELSESMMRKVTPEELAEETGLSVEKIIEAIRISGNQIEEIDMGGR